MSEHLQSAANWWKAADKLTMDGVGYHHHRLLSALLHHLMEESQRSSVAPHRHRYDPMRGRGWTTGAEPIPEQPAEMPQYRSHFWKREDERRKLEAETPQSEQEPSATTESAITADRSAADSRPEAAPTLTANTIRTIPLSVRLLGRMSPVERTHVARCSGCRGRLDQFVSSLLTHVPDVGLLTSTYPRAASNSSAASLPDDATSPSGSSSLSSPSPVADQGAVKDG